MGAWVSYGLGTENQNLPAFLVLPDTRLSAGAGAENWSDGFLPALLSGHGAARGWFAHPGYGAARRRDA